MMGLNNGETKKSVRLSFAYQNKMKSVQSILASWDLGIMMGHENFGIEVTNSDGDGSINGISAIKGEFGQEYDHKIDLNLLKLNNNQGFSEQLSKQYYFMKAQSIPFPANFEQ